MTLSQKFSCMCMWNTSQPYINCQNAFSIFTSLGEECLTLALKGRCQNQMKRRQTGPERLLENVRLVGGPLRGGTISSGTGSRLVERATGGLCEVHFLPLVVEVGDSNRTQRLRCAGESSALYTKSCFFNHWATQCVSPFLQSFACYLCSWELAYLAFCQMETWVTKNFRLALQLWG